MKSHAGPTAMERLRRKLERAGRFRAREEFFGMRILPVLTAWAMLLAAVSVVAGALIPLGITLTLFFSGSLVLVLWLARRARLHVD